MLKNLFLLSVLCFTSYYIFSYHTPCKTKLASHNKFVARINKKIKELMDPKKTYPKDEIDAINRNKDYLLRLCPDIELHEFVELIPV